MNGVDANGHRRRKETPLENESRVIAVIGAGLMGHGIALEFALAGHAVRLHDLTEAQLQQALQNLEKNLRMMVALGLVTKEAADRVPARIRTEATLAGAVEDVDLVIEAVSEDLALKQRLFAQLDALCPERTILASNTSIFMPGKLASATRRPGKVLVVHYFNPPYLLPLVEIVRCEVTSDATVETIFHLLKSLGKRPVLVQKEVPGFIGNRLQIALMREALSIVQQGIASPQDVDLVIKSSFGRRLALAGIFEIFDIAGWDIGLTVYSQLVSEIDSSNTPPPLLTAKVERGELGLKTGQGFYEWTPESADALKARIARGLVELGKLDDTD